MLYMHRMHPHLPNWCVAVGVRARWAGRRLSPGEQQRLSFARLLLRGRAGRVFLDEATAALDTHLEVGGG